MEMTGYGAVRLAYAAMGCKRSTGSNPGTPTKDYRAPIGELFHWKGYKDQNQAIKLIRLPTAPVELELSPSAIAQVLASLSKIYSGDGLPPMFWWACRSLTMRRLPD